MTLEVQPVAVPPKSKLQKSFPPSVKLLPATGLRTGGKNSVLHQVCRVIPSESKAFHYSSNITVQNNWIALVHEEQRAPDGILIISPDTVTCLGNFGDNERQHACICVTVFSCLSSV